MDEVHVHTTHRLWLNGKVYPSLAPVRQTPAQANQFISLMSEMMEQQRAGDLWLADRIHITVREGFADPMDEFTDQKEEPRQVMEAEADYPGYSYY